MSENHKIEKNNWGQVIAICRSEEKGEAKTEIEAGYLKENYGLKGDAHAGDWHRQISLLGQEDIDEMRAQGLELEAGAFGENIVTKGLELYELPIGSRLKIGDEILLEVTQIGKECHDRCEIYQQVGDCIMPKRGIFAKVLAGGKIESDLLIEVMLND
ncbi:MOSC domain-containing protein [Halanaerobacter jeridensis]|uniref:Cyclic pyranopterin phosphate synthase n=1 Tax=Halanaerobacter jeridensis TaxID=706427 RepID=A0A938XQ10_9FIRM|nr:cyclic pyranopterin phosphate synthase [Halanaerobacter jeridensis]